LKVVFLLPCIGGFDENNSKYVPKRQKGPMIFQLLEIKRE
jgi:hypothetical protein